MKEQLGTSEDIPFPKPRDGYDVWIEDGIWYTAPIVDRAKFGPHSYNEPNQFSITGDCICGCWLGRSQAGGPVNPFGACPSNPREQ